MPQLLASLVTRGKALRNAAVHVITVFKTTAARSSSWTPSNDSHDTKSLYDLVCQRLRSPRLKLLYFMPTSMIGRLVCLQISLWVVLILISVKFSVFRQSNCLLIWIYFPFIATVANSRIVCERLAVRGTRSYPAPW